MSRHSHSPVNAYSRFPPTSAALSPSRSHGHHSAATYDDASGASDMIPPISARSSRSSRARDRELEEELERDRDLVYAREGEVEARRRGYRYDDYGNRGLGESRTPREALDYPTADPYHPAASSSYHVSHAQTRGYGHEYDRDDRAREVRARRHEEYGDYDGHRDRGSRRYTQAEDVDWRNEPASPQRGLPPLSSIAPSLPTSNSAGSAGAGGGRMALSSLLDSAPGPAAGAHTRVSGAVPGGTTSPPPAPLSALEESRAPARQSGRHVHSLDYEPVQSSQVFYGAPPGYAGGSTRNGHDLRARGGAGLGGLTPSYASAMYDNGLYDERDRITARERERDADAEREGRRVLPGESARVHAVDSHGYMNGRGYHSSRHGAYPHYDVEGSRSPSGIPANLLPGDPRLPPIPPPGEGYEPSRTHDRRRDTSPAPARDRSGFSRRETRQSTSTSPIRRTGQAEPGYADSSRGREYDGYATSASAAAAGYAQAQGRALDGGMMVAAPASARHRSHAYHRGGADDRRQSFTSDRDGDRVDADIPPYSRSRDYAHEHDDAAYARSSAPRASRQRPRRYSRADNAEMADEIANGHSPNGRIVTGADIDEHPEANGTRRSGRAHASQSPSKTIAYKLSDMLAESKDVWQDELNAYQKQRELEVAEIAELDLEAVHAEVIKIKPTMARSRPPRPVKPAAPADPAPLTPAAESAVLPEIKPVVGKGRKGAQARASTGGKAKSAKARSRKSAANVEIEDELLGLAEGDDLAATSVVAPSSPGIAEHDEDDNDKDGAEASLPDPDAIVHPCGLPRHEVIRRVAAQELDGLTDKDVKAVQDEIWHREAEAKGSELARTRDGRIKKKPGPAKGWKKLKGEDGMPGSGVKRKKDKDVPSSMRGSDDEEEGREPVSEIGLEEGDLQAEQADKVKEEEEEEAGTATAELGTDPDAEAAIGALLDEPEPSNPSKNEARNEARRKKRKMEAQREQGVLYDEDEIAGAFGPIPVPGTTALQLEDAVSDRRSSIADHDEDHSVLLPNKRKAGKGKAGAAGSSKKSKKGKDKEIGPALSGGPLALPMAYGSHPDAALVDDYSDSARDDAGYYDAFGIGQGSTDLPPPHAPLHFNVTPKGSDTNSLPLPPDGGFEDLTVPAPTESVKPAPTKGDKGKEAPVVKATNVEDPRGVSVEEAHARLAVVEELQKHVWSALVKDVPKVYRVMQGFDSANKAYKQRTAQACIRNLQRASKNAKSAAMVKKDATTKAKRAVREMLVYWRKNEKDELLARKKSEKEALEKAKQEEEQREAKRQERKLHFLLTQTELYSHFIGKKIKTADAERPDGETGDGAVGAGAEGDDEHADVEGLDGDHAADLPDLDYDEDDEANLRKHAARGAAAHARAAREKAAQFDQQRAQKAANGDVDLKGVDLDGDELNFQEPSLGANSVTITQPKILMAQLKEYQLKGLTWLGNLYEQGINGILADEMGLGKTIQSISLLAYLAEQHNLWGPFLVITPVSTLHNWMQEIARFVPALNVIPYWGQPKDREVLRSIWCKRHATYDKDSRFHVLVTSYQMAVQDEKYLSSLRWQYMILDEAQAIKSSSSMRWTTLLGLPCRNRLLLTGTPIQNSMQELWALLHFIMPTLFDSHEEFSEWFSKDIEKTAASGNTGNLQPEQLKRLHMILKPFMLRRVKKHVQKELGEKIEIDVMVDMSQRQKTLYRALRQRVSISELLAQASNLNDSAGTKHLMNLVMQFRKVCSHPDLFERADVVSPFFFGTFSQSGRTTKEGDNMYCPASGRNAIAPTLPRLVWEDKVDRPKEESNAGDKRWILNNMMSIWNPDWVVKRLKEEQQRDDGYGFLRFLDQSPAKVAKAAKGHPLVQLVSGAEDSEDLQNDGAYEGDSTFAAAKPSKRFTVPPRIPLAELEHDTPLKDISNIAWNRSVLSRKSSRFAIDAAAAAPIKPIISSRSYVSEAAASQSDPLITRALYGVAPSERNDPYAVRQLHNLVPGISPNGLLAAAPEDQVPRASLNVPPIKRLIVDSAKLARLDELLRELKDGGHRVLLYFQMTKMMDLVEEYLIFRQHKYLRLDGTTVLEERRDMVNSWQTNPEIFVFCLSTRAGGLGINLTAADTVIFYDHDWNPSNDAQAMDRAHRVGQTKQVTVYRLITRNTIEERIVRMARAKKDVQDIVVGTKSLNDVAKPSEIASLFMDDEELAESVAKRKQAEAHGYVAPAPGRQQRKSAFGDGLGGMDDDEDDFFSSGAQKGANNEDEDFADVDGNQQGGNAAGIVGNGPAGAPDGKKKSGGSKKKKPTTTTGGGGVGGSGAATPAEGDAEKKKAGGGGGTKRKAVAGEGESGDGKKKKKVKIVQPDERASMGSATPAE